MDHMKILKRAWQITKKYRALWWIGLLLVLAGGGLGAGARGSAPSGNASGWRTSAPQWQEPFRDWQNMPNMPNMPNWPQVWQWAAPAAVAVLVLVIVLGLLAIVLGLVGLVLRLVTRGSLIRMVNGYEESGEQVRFGAGMRLGWSRSAWRFFLLELMLAIPVMVLILVLIAPLIGLAVAGFAASDPNIALGVVAILTIIPVILLGVVLGIVLAPIKELAYRVIAVEDVGPWAAFKATLALVRRHLGPATLQWLILIGMRIAWAIVLIPVNLVLVFVALFAGGLPGLLVGGLAALAAQSPFGLLLGGLVFLPVFVIVIAVPNVALNTLATVYYSTAWTLTYRELLALDAEVSEVEPEVLETETAEAKVS